MFRPAAGAPGERRAGCARSPAIDAFLEAFDALPAGYVEGTFAERRYGVTRSVSADGRRGWLYGEELGGPGRISCNLYRLGGGRAALRPCEMPADKVVGFVLAFRPDAPAGPAP